jgi:MraZ protein
MLIGEYSHTLDPKKRVSLPAKFRKELGKNIILTRGLDNCIFIYPTREWKAISEKLSDLSLGQASSRSFNRFLLSGATEVEIKEFAKLDTAVVIAGVHNRLEIWDEKRWRDYTRVIERDADKLAEGLGEIGMI